MYNESQTDIQNHHDKTKPAQALDPHHGFLLGSQNPRITLPNEEGGYGGNINPESRTGSYYGESSEGTVQKSGVQPALHSSPFTAIGLQHRRDVVGSLEACHASSEDRQLCESKLPKLNPLATEFVPSGFSSVQQPAGIVRDTCHADVPEDGERVASDGLPGLPGPASWHGPAQQGQAKGPAAQEPHTGASSNAAVPPRQHATLAASEEPEQASGPSTFPSHVRPAANSQSRGGGGRGRGGNRGGRQLEAGQGRGGLSAAFGESSRGGYGLPAASTNRPGPLQHGGEMTEIAGSGPAFSEIPMRPAGNQAGNHAGNQHAGNHAGSHSASRSGGPSANRMGPGVSRSVISQDAFGHGAGSGGAGHGFPGSTPPGRKSKGSSHNANHLLNFRYEPIQRATPGRGGRGAYNRRQSRPPPPFNKELFLQANFRFLVSDLGDYSQHGTDPDKTLDWHQVAAVEVEEPSCPQCPICLEAPALCPQITACGHMFCFPCIVHYLISGEEGRKEHWKKCPLCFATIGTRDLRSANIHVAAPPVPGDTLRFSLLVRAKNSIIPFDRSVLGDPSSSINALPYSENGLCHRFAKFTLTSVEGAEAAANATEAELMEAAMKAQSSAQMEERDRVPYILAAVDFLQERKQVWAKHRAEDFMSSSPPVQKRIMAQSKTGAAHLSTQKESRGTSCPEKTLDGGATPKKTASPFPKSFAESLAGGMQGTNSSAAQGGASVANQHVPDVSADADAAMARLIEEASWVYESAFSSEEEGPRASVKRKTKGKAGGKKSKEKQPAEGLQGTTSRQEDSTHGKRGEKDKALSGPRGNSASQQASQGEEQTTIAQNQAPANGKPDARARDTDTHSMTCVELGSGHSSLSGVGSSGSGAPGPDHAASVGNGKGGALETQEGALGTSPVSLSDVPTQPGVESNGLSGSPTTGQGPWPASESSAPAGSEGKKSGQKEGDERPYYMFYQAEDGRPLILHTVSMKCLLQHYGSYEKLPHSIEAKVLEVTPETQSEVNRKRLKFLNHLPLTAHLSLVEVEVGDLVPPSATAPFAEELRQREQRRQRRLAQELEERSRAEREVSVPRGPQPPTAADFAAILSSMDDEDLSSLLTITDLDHSAASPNSAPLEDTQAGNRVLFSRVAKMGYASGLNAPELSPLQAQIGSAESGPTAARSATSGSVTGSPSVRSVWGTPLSLRGSGQPGGPGQATSEAAAAPPSPSPSPLLSPSPSSPWGPQAVQGPPATRLATMLQAPAGSSKGQLEDPSKGGKKKGKKGVTVLMTTNMRRG